MKRRGFLAALIAVISATLLPRWQRRAPKLWGDGIHDDTAALQWRVDHGPPVVGGQYLIAGTIHFRPGVAGGIFNSRLIGAGQPSPMIQIHNEAVRTRWNVPLSGSRLWHQ